jgi:hypothetical protein
MGAQGAEPPFSAVSGPGRSGGEKRTVELVIAPAWRAVITDEAFVRTVEPRPVAGSNRQGVQEAHLNPLGLFLRTFFRTSIPFVWCILSAFLPA